MASSATKRIWYAKYACQKSGPFPSVEILGKDNRRVSPAAIEAFAAFNQALVRTEYDARVVGTYNCRSITRGRKLSLHAFGIAVDVDPYNFGNPYYGRSHPKGWKFSWAETKFTPNQVQSVERIRTNSGKKVWLWGGRWNTIKDYMHWELDVPPKDLETGINWKTVPGGLLEGKGGQVLKKGNKGNAVGKFQTALVAWNSDKLPSGVDGIFGNETEQAVRDYQNAADIDATGVIDGLTGSLLLEYVEDRAGGVGKHEHDDRYVRRGIQETSTFK